MEVMDVAAVGAEVAAAPEAVAGAAEEEVSRSKFGNDFRRFHR